MRAGILGISLLWLGAAAAQLPEDEPIEFEAIEVTPEYDPLFDAERRLRALIEQLPGTAEEKELLRERALRALGLDGDFAVDELKANELRQVESLVDALQSNGAVGDREPPGPQLPVRLSEREKRLQEILEGVEPVED